MANIIIIIIIFNVWCRDPHDPVVELVRLIAGLEKIKGLSPNNCWPFQILFGFVTYKA